MKAITNPNQYFQVLNTGRLDAMYAGEMGQLLLIQAENEKLMDGKSPRAIASDQHKEHILEHTNVLNDPDLREDMTLVKQVQDHIQEHLDFLRNTDPGLLSLTNQQPLPALQPPGQGPTAPQPNAPGGPPPQQPSPQQGPPPGGQPAPGVLKKSPVPTEMAPNAGLPKPGEPVGLGQDHAENLPNLPKPPGQFKHLPVVTSQMIPQPK